MLCFPVCCLQAPLLKSDTLHLPHYSPTHHDAVALCFTLMCVCVQATADKNRSSCSVMLHAIVCFTATLNRILFALIFLLFIIHVFSSHIWLFLTFKLFLVLSYYFHPASLLCCLWAVLWCQPAGPTQLSGTSFLTLSWSLNSVQHGDLLKYSCIPNDWG